MHHLHIVCGGTQMRGGYKLSYKGHKAWPPRPPFHLALTGLHVVISPDNGPFTDSSNILMPASVIKTQQVEKGGRGMTAT